MAQAAIIVRVLRRGSRVQQLLAALSERLGLDPLEPDEGGLVVVRMDGRPPQAWERVREGLDAAGPDWREWLHLSPRPNR